MKNLFLRVLLFAFLPVFLNACSDNPPRLLRNSPFGTEKPATADSSVNLWPMYYGNGEFHSVLWPMADWDKRGFAVRPLYTQDDSAGTVLFPLSGWGKDYFWILSGYQTPKSYGVVPLFYKSDYFNYILLSYWVENNKGETYYWGIFPLTHFSNKLKFTGPVWWKSSSSNNDFGFFPLYYQWGWNEGAFFPLYGYKNIDDSISFQLLCYLFAQYKKTQYGEFHYRFFNTFYAGNKNLSCHSVLPFYYMKKDSFNDITFITPLGGASWNDASNETKMIDILGPLFIKSNYGTEEFTSSRQPPYTQYLSKSYSTYASLPLFWYQTGGCTLGIFRYLGIPLFTHVSGRDDNYTNSILGIWLFYQDAYQNIYFEGNNFFITPFFYWNNEKFFDLDKTNQKIFSGDIQGPLYLNSESLLTYFFFFDIGSRKYNIWADSKNKNNMQTIYNSLKTLNREYCDNLQYKMYSRFPVKASWSWKNRSKIKDQILHLDGIGETIQKNCVDRKALEEEKYIWELKQNIYAYNNEKLAIIEFSRGNNIDPVFIDMLQRGEDAQTYFWEKYTSTKDSFIFQLPLLFGFETFGENYKWNILYFLARAKSLETKEHFSVLEYFYRYEREGDNSSRLIFPFIKTNSTARKSHFSFIWRVFDYSSEKDKTYGHIFFIPFGSEPDGK